MRQLILSLMLASAATAGSQEVSWPLPRGTHSMAWHDRLQQVLLLGGAEASKDSALWGWDGARWRTLATGGPAGRAHFAMAYDASRDRLLVHGGFVAVFGTNNPTRLGDTWEWDGRAWKRVSTGGPAGRDHHTMAYDPVRKQIVLFGGADSTGTQLGDTWIWDGRAWERRATDGPPGRSTHRMAFDTKRGVLVLFGGANATGVLNDTWEWNGQRWTQITTTAAPAARFASRMAYDAARERVVLFGGRAGNANFNDTWEYDGRTWVKLDVAGPSARNIHEMLYDPRARATLLFGGFNAPSNFDDFWSFDGKWKQIPRPDARAVGADYVVRGPYAVGYRLINHWDLSRRLTPARDFDGQPSAGDGARPLQVSVWYPAQAGGTPMRLGEYYAISSKSETLAPVTDADLAAAVASIRNTNFSLGIDLPQRTADSIAVVRAAAVRDANPADGRFPLIVSGFGGPVSAYGLGEYLASYGYVVVTAATVGTAAQQVTRVPVAIETHTRDIEMAQSIASALPFVDKSRVGLVGMNFNGLAVLTHQMRNMGADAIVSLDGYEAKSPNGAGLRASPYFDPARVRVPYLSFSQDNWPRPDFAFNSALIRDLKYSARYSYVVHDMEHVHLLTNLLIYPQLRAEQRLGYEFVWRTTRSFLDAYVKRDTAGKAFITRSAVQNGFPAWLIETELKLPALPAIPTGEETEAIAMTGSIERLRTILRQARAADSTARVFDIDALDLYAFRFLQHRNDRQTALAFNQLAIDAYPKSVAATNNMADTYRTMGEPQRAIPLYERALTLIDGDPDLAPADRARTRTAIENNLRQLRPR